MESVCLRNQEPQIEVVKNRFIAHIEKITNSTGICPTSDIVAPEQCGYVGPGLGITILPDTRGRRGCLELWVSYVGADGLELTSQTDRILSVPLRSATIQIGPVNAELTEHDHVCIPAGLEARIYPRGQSPLVILDTSIS
jgi:hypothetical protein